MRRRYAIVAALLLLPLLGFIDYVTGLELNFFAFYYVPVALLAWYVGTSAGVAAATVCAALWYVVDRASGHIYTSLGVGAWNAGLRWLAFLLVALVLAALRRKQLREEELNRELAATVRQLQASLARVSALQNDVQIVCAWTKRIKSEGRWITFEDFMTQHFQLRFSHGISEEAYEQVKAEMAREDPRVIDRLSEP